jgi:DNA-binding NtrC family response regulator
MRRLCLAAGKPVRGPGWQGREKGRGEVETGQNREVEDRMKTILVVDNSYSTLLLLREEFAEAGYAVLTTESGQEALDILKNPSQKIDLLITNLRHAGPDMLDFMWLIKKTWPDLPVICHTALYKYKNLAPQERPFDAFVDKSSDLSGLKDSVARLIGQKREIKKF